MNFKDILNYPLLSGERAERWAMPWIEKPALVVAATTAAFTGLAVVGPWATLGLAVAYTLQVDRLMIEAAKVVYNAAKVNKPDADEADDWETRYNRAANNVRIFVQKHTSRHKPVSLNLRHKGGLGTASCSSDSGHININFTRLCQGHVAPEAATERGKFIAAHELGHLSNFSYLRIIAGYVAPRVATTAAAIGVYMLAVGGGTLAAAVLAGLGALGTVLATTLSQRQEEYRCDRHAVRMTRNPAAGREVLVIKQIDSGLSPTVRPSLLINSLLSHPCMANRVREMTRYDKELALKQAKSPNPQ